MALKATFPEGASTLTLNGLYQWDCGRVLEIESADIGTQTVEIHFACQNMTEAIARVCSFTNGFGNVTIPDVCLEQSSPITVWIYEINGTEGRTLKSVVLNVTARTRPSKTKDIPQEIADKYTELITEVNEAIDALENGTVEVAKAKNAANAVFATSAGNAECASHAVATDQATSALNASLADLANKATSDTEERTFVDNYFHIGETCASGEILADHTRLNPFHVALVDASGMVVRDLGVVCIFNPIWSNYEYPTYRSAVVPAFPNEEGIIGYYVLFENTGLTGNENWFTWKATPYAVQMTVDDSFRANILHYQITDLTVKVDHLTKPQEYVPE